MFTAKQIAALRREFAKIDRIDPCGAAYRDMIEKLDAMDQLMLRQLTDANIKFMSRLAANRVQYVPEPWEPEDYVAAR